MVFLQLPPNYTDEEIMLQAKYDKLKRKKKALQIIKMPKQEPDRTTPTKKPKLDGKDAREIAKKLLKSGAISAIKKTQKREGMAGFKRPRGSIGKKNEGPLSAYQPFAGNCEDSRPRNPYNHQPEEYTSHKNQTKKPKMTGRSVFVKGHKITEAGIKNTFSEYGDIIAINVDYEKSQCFVIFKKALSAESCISGLNGSIYNEHQLSVSYAKQQPQDLDESPTKTDQNLDPSRTLISYNDDFF